jgi:hypothetical protein
VINQNFTKVDGVEYNVNLNGTSLAKKESIFVSKTENFIFVNAFPLINTNK